jgi:hypothetical protein
VLCYTTDETSSHLFLACNFSMSLSQWLGKKMNCSINLASIANILDCILVHCSSQACDVYVAAIVHTVHTIWMARIILHFSFDKISLNVAKVKIVFSVALSGNISKGNYLPWHFR